MIENRMFLLKHKNHDVAILQLSPEGDIENFEVISPARMPFLGSGDKKHLHIWWKNRAIPEGRERLIELLKKYDCKSPGEFLMKNLGLSLTDAYWLSPAEMDLSWDEVNLFSHGNKTLHFHSGDGRVHYSNQRDASLGGNLEKFSVHENGLWYLTKYSDSKHKDGLQNVNEGFASMVHGMQGFKEFASYDISCDDRGQSICKCSYFTGENIELIPAFEVTGGYDPFSDYDGKTELEKFIDICTCYGLEREYVQSFIDYMLMTDFVITNSDRHWYNFGILRDAETLRFISMAPLYDNGNSMFYDMYSVMNRASLLRLEDNGIIRQEAERLELIKDRNLVNFSKLPSPSTAKEFYLSHGIDPDRVKIITESYSNKLDLFMEFQHGFKIDYNTEMYDYISEVPVIRQKFNDKFFRERPDMQRLRK